MDEIIDEYASSRLLSLDHDAATRQPTVEVAHEAILREWDRLRQWLNLSRDDIRQQRIVAEAAADWDEHRRDTSFLLRGMRLEQAESWYQATELSLTPLEKDFIAASVRQRKYETDLELTRVAEKEAQEKRSRNLLRALVAVFALATLLSGGFGLFALNERNNAIQSQQETEQALATSRRSAWAFAANTAIDRDEMDLAIALAMQSVEGGELLPETLRVLERISETSGPRTWIDHTDTQCRTVPSLDREYVLTTDCVEKVLMWNIRTGEVVQTFSETDVPIVATGISLSPDNQRLITFDGEHTFALWDVATGEIINQFQHDSNLLWFDFAWDGTQIWVIEALPSDPSGFNKILLYDVLTGEMTKEYTFDGRVFTSLAFNSDGTLGAVAGWADPEAKDKYRASIFDVETGEILKTFDRAYTGENQPDWDTQGPDPLDFSPDNSILWFGGYPNYFINTATGEDVLTVGDGRINWPLDDDFERSLVVTQTGEPIVIDIATGAEEHLPTLMSPSVGPDARNIVSSVHGNPGIAQLWDLDGRSADTMILKGSAWSSTVFSPDGRQLAVVSDAQPTSHVQIWDTENWELLHTFDGVQFEGFDIDWSSDGHYIAAGTTYEGVYVWDARTYAEVHHLTDLEQEIIMNVQFTADGRYLVAAHGSWMPGFWYDVPLYLMVWDVASGEVVQRIDFPAETQNWGIFHITIAPNSYLAFVGVADSYITVKTYVVDLLSGEIIRENPPELDGKADFTPDGTQLVFSNFNTGTIYIVSTETGEILRHWQSLDSSIEPIAVSPNGQYVATGSGAAAFESDVSLWNLQTGELYRRYIGHQAQSFLNDIKFSPDSTQLVSTAIDGTVRVWEVDTQSSLDWVRENRAVRGLTCAERELYRIEPLCEQ